MGQTPLWHVSASEFFLDEKSVLEVLQFLIDNGSDVNIKDKKGNTPLHIVKEAKIARCLINHGANINAKNEYGFTPLHMASRKGRIEVVKLLLEKGAQIEAKDNLGRTPLHHVENAEITKCLIDNGAEVEAKIDIDDEDDFVDVDVLFEFHNMTLGMTPLYSALWNSGNCSNDPEIIKCKIDIVQCLIDNGAQIEAKEDYYGWTPLHFASGTNCNSRIEGVKCLVENGAKIDARTDSGETPLHFAAIDDYGLLKPEVAQYLIDNGAQIDAVDKNGETPLHRACGSVADDKNQNLGNPEIVKCLLENGAQIEVKSNISRGYTPLHFASLLPVESDNNYSAFETINYLLENGAQI